MHCAHDGSFLAHISKLGPRTTVGRQILQSNGTFLASRSMLKELSLVTLKPTRETNI